MRRTLFVLAVIGLIAQVSASPVFAQAAADISPGEQITYNIKKFGVKVGEAQLKFCGIVSLDGREFVLITFRSAATNFLDEEKIYADPVTLLPVRVERDLNLWGKKEKIIEHYDQAKGQVKVVKTAGGKTTEQILSRGGVVDNLYCFISRYRRSGRFVVGEEIKMRLPTMDVTVKLKQKTRIAAAGSDFEAYYMESVPGKYKIWFDGSPRRIPLRIDGSAGIASTSLVMSRHQKL